MPTNTTLCGWTTATWWCPTTAGCFAGTIPGCPICLRDCKSPKRMRWACTQCSARSAVLGSQDNGTSHQTRLHQARVLDGDGFDCFFSGNTTDTLYASAYYGLLYRSTNGGRTMTQIAGYFGGTGFRQRSGGMAHAVSTAPGRSWTHCDAKKSLHHSDDGGDSWTSWSEMGDVRSTALALSSSDPEVGAAGQEQHLVRPAWTWRVRPG